MNQGSDVISEGVTLTLSQILNKHEQKANATKKQFGDLAEKVSSFVHNIDDAAKDAADYLKDKLEEAKNESRKLEAQLREWVDFSRMACFMLIFPTSRLSAEVSPSV